MNNQFDELTKQMAQSVTRRAAVKKFGIGIAGMALACFGVRSLSATPPVKKRGYCEVIGLDGGPEYTGTCWDPVTCQYGTSSDCGGAANNVQIGSNPCNPGYVGIDFKKRCSL